MPNEEEELNGVEESETPLEEEPTLVSGWDLAEAVEYVTFHAVDNEDFLASDDITKARFLNVGHRTLQRAFKGYTIPLQADYLFACVLNANYNDTTVYAQRGVASFSVDGINFTFKDWAKKDLTALITDEIKEMINEANPDAPVASGGKLKWVTL